MAKASFTVEAVFVVSICIWVLVALCYEECMYMTGLLWRRM